MIFTRLKDCQDCRIKNLANLENPVKITVLAVNKK